MFNDSFLKFKNYIGKKISSSNKSQANTFYLMRWNSEIII